VREGRGRQFHAEPRSGGRAATLFHPSVTIKSTGHIGVLPDCFSLARRLDCVRAQLEPALGGKAKQPETGTGSHSAND
jgi:hypothetical protein